MGYYLGAELTSNIWPYTMSDSEAIDKAMKVFMGCALIRFYSCPLGRVIIKENRAFENLL